MPQQTTWRTEPALPDFIVRAKAQTLELRVFDEDGTLTAPASGTLTLTKEDGKMRLSPPFRASLPFATRYSHCPPRRRRRNRPSVGGRSRGPVEASSASLPVAPPEDSQKGVG